MEDEIKPTPPQVHDLVPHGGELYALTSDGLYVVNGLWLKPIEFQARVPRVIRVVGGPLK